MSIPRHRQSLPRFLFENALHDAGTDDERSADFEDTVCIGPQLQYSRLDRRLDPTASQFCSVRSGARQRSIYPFSNDPSLELSKHAEHLKHRFARGSSMNLVSLLSACRKKSF
jgi:hypothetical protein